MTVAAAPPKSTSSDSATTLSPAASNSSEDTDEIDEADVCAPPACNVALVSQPGTRTTADFILPVQQLGFAASAEREMYDLDHDVAICYLGPNQLLFTFNPHLLVPRSRMEIGFPKLHVVRATLIDLPTMKVVQTVDWRIHDTQQYLWSMGRDSVLVHVGRQLRIYGSNLKVERRLVLNGPLAFVRVAPSGAYLAVGTVRERHSEAIHRELAAAENREPEEDVEVKVLDPTFRVLASVTRSSREAPPCSRRWAKFVSLPSARTAGAFLSTPGQGRGTC